MEAFAVLLLISRMFCTLGYAFRLPVQSIVASKRKSPSALPSTDFLSLLDKNHDGKLSTMEIVTAPAEVLKHSPLITSFLATIKSIFHRGLSGSMTSLQLWQQVSSLMSLGDLAIIGTLIVGYRPALHLLYSFVCRENSPPYEESLLGRMEFPLRLFVYFPPFLYLVDLLSILLQYLGFDFLVKGDLPRLCCTWGLAIIGGSFVTHLKNYIFFELRSAAYANTPEQRDFVKEKTIDELTSLCVWVVVAGVCVQATSLELGVGLKSLFALGGLGSASFVLALRSTMENLVGGVLLR
ncbi:hypothetical protein EON65_38340 [archaeon]|nr:MAG: hypothetical protein EON65_38340 [archaeon]